MQSRSRIFLTFAFFCVLPLLLISGLSFFLNLRSSEKLLTSELQHELATTSQRFELLLHERKQELKSLAESSALQNYLRSAGISGLQRDQEDNNADLAETRKRITSLIKSHHSYAKIAAFDEHQRPVFLAESSPGNAGAVLFRTRDVVFEMRPEPGLWDSAQSAPLCLTVSTPSLGKALRCITPIDQTTRATLVADLKLDSLISLVAGATDNSTAERPPEPSLVMLVLDERGEIVYHTNAALKHQQARTAMAYFDDVATAMMAGHAGAKSFQAYDGKKWLARYAPLVDTKLSLAVARNYSLFSQEARSWGWIGVVAALLLGLLTAMVLTRTYSRKTKSIDRLAAGVGEIAKGKLDHQIELLSSDDLRPLADNVGLMTKQLREQIAREAESRQFQSFVRLSAVLTHDLKNAIEALSLIVTNMEQHFEKEEFRADAMQSLTAATEKLRALVARLSNPVNTLSGEHKRPQPLDLVPILKRVIAMTAEPARSRHEIQIDLPPSLFALVDATRIDKVMENLIINAIEAMGDKRGTLTIAAGMMDGKPYFSVSDTGHGMSERFIAEQLFHPFATTKRKGVGLGLYTCREVVQAHGGTITVNSKQGAGTTFRVVLPSASIEAR